MFYSVSLAEPARHAHWLAVALILVGLGTANAAPTTSCAGNGTGISLSPGFCSSIFADHIGHGRHLRDSPSGGGYVNTRGGTHYTSGPILRGGWLGPPIDSPVTG